MLHTETLYFLKMLSFAAHECHRYHFRKKPWRSHAGTKFETCCCGNIYYNIETDRNICPFHEMGLNKMDWKTILATIAFLALVLIQAKMNEDDHHQSQLKDNTAKSSVLNRGQASLPTSHK